MSHQSTLKFNNLLLIIPKNNYIFTDSLIVDHHIFPTTSKMENTLLYSAILFTFFLVLSINLLLRTRKQRKNLPPSPLSLPIIGHFHLLKQPIHRTLEALSQKYGPVFSLKFGSRLAIIVSSPSGVEECLLKKDIVFANRPHVLSGRILNYNDTTMGTADYGDHWRNLRRISAIEIFSSTRLNAFLGMRKDEVKLLLSRLHRVSIHGFSKVELRPLLFDLTSNIMMRMIAGKRYYGEGVKEIDKAREFREMMEEFIHYTGAATAGDFLPFLQWLDLNGYVNKLDRLSKRMDAFFQGLIDEHRVDRNRNTMISHFLTLQESQPEYYTDEIIKGHVLVNKFSFCL